MAQVHSTSTRSFHSAPTPAAPALTVLSPPRAPLPAPAPARSTAIVYCEANFGAVDGKTANGLVRHSERYEILSVIDSSQSGLDAHEVLGHKSEGVPICTDLEHAIALAGCVPDYLIYGIAPASGMLSKAERGVILDAMARGMHVVSGLHEFLGDDPEFSAASDKHDVTILDVRRPRGKRDLRTFSGRIATVACPRIAVMGTDCAIGKRTTATILTRALNERGIKTVLVATGQTGLIQGARHAVALDAVPSQFCAGEMEATVVEAYEAVKPDVIVIEGQGALSHPAYLTSGFILRGSQPQGVILQHAPARRTRADFPDAPMPDPASEIRLIETFSDTRVIGLTVNHEEMSDAEVSAAIALYELELGIPATDALTRPVDQLVDMVLAAFPQLVKAPSTERPHGTRLDKAVAKGRSANRGGNAMLNLDLATAGSGAVLAGSTEAAGLEDAVALRLLVAEDAESVARLATWLKVNAKTFAPLVAQAIHEGSSLSAEAAGAVLDAFTWRAPADAETTVTVMNACLVAITDRITESIRKNASDAISDSDDSLVGSAVVILTANRRSSQTEAAICCLAAAGPGGALVLARAFDAVRSALRLYIVRRLNPADVLELGDNVVASLARSVSKLADELESPKKAVATRFLEELGSVQHMETSEVGTTDLLGVGDRVFHASWGAGVVIASGEDSVTIDFGSAGTRTLLRALATLRRAG